MKKTDIGEITGILDGVIKMEGGLGLEVGVKVAGQDFLKRFWNDSESLPKKRKMHKNAVDLAFSTEESNYKEEFVEDHNPHVGEVVNLKFREVRVNWIHYISDWLHGPRYPRRYREILSISYQNNPQSP